MQNSSLQVGIDISAAAFNRGVSRYTTNLVQALSDLPKVDLHLYGTSLRQSAPLDKLVAQVKPKDAVIQRIPPRVHEFIWQYTKLNSIRSHWPQLDVFHSWDWLQPPDRNLPLVSTIHDLSILKYPEVVHPKVLAMHRRSWQILQQQHAHIIAVSQATKQDILNLLDFSPKRVHVVYEALPNETKLVAAHISAEQENIIKDKLDLNLPYILFIGTQEPRKNLPRLVEAWWPMRKDIQLIIAGRSGWGTDIKQQHANLRFVGEVSNKQLAVLYRNAQLLAFPSLDEGFGLPILEAFYHKTKVLTSNRSAMQEVAGNAAQLVDPENTDSIAEGIDKLMNESAAASEERQKRMRLRLQLFNWQTTAINTLKVYQAAMQDFAKQTEKANI